MGGGYIPNSGRPPGGQVPSCSFSSLMPIRHWARDQASRSWPLLGVIVRPQHVAAADARPAPQPAHTSPVPPANAGPPHATVPPRAASLPTVAQPKPAPKPWWEP